jgi:soluble lytic murein transglycosylase
MQLMPATALEVNPQLDLHLLHTPEVNIEVGTRYLKQLLAEFNGNVPKALAAYNAGPNAVKRWVKEGKDQGGLHYFVERIPYKETREYVASILKNYYWYSTELNPGSEPNWDSFWK